MKKLILASLVIFSSIVSVFAANPMEKILPPDENTRPRLTNQAPIIVLDKTFVAKK